MVTGRQFQKLLDFLDKIEEFEITQFKSISKAGVEFQQYEGIKASYALAYRIANKDKYGNWIMMIYDTQEMEFGVSHNVLITDPYENEFELSFDSLSEIPKFLVNVDAEFAEIGIPNAYEIE